MAEPYVGNSSSEGVAGLAGINTTPGAGVWGQSDTGRGVVGVSKTGAGVWGHTGTGRAVVGACDGDGAAVWGDTKTGRGVVGIAREGDGVGVWGQVGKGRAVVGACDADGVGVWGETKTGRGVVGVVQEGTGTAVHGVKKGAGGLAALFEGDVAITGNLTIQTVSIQSWLQRIVTLEQRQAAQPNVAQLQQRISQLEQTVQTLQQQLNSVASNLTGRVTQTEFAIKALQAVAHTHQ